MAAVVLCSRRLMFLYSWIIFACLAFVNLMFSGPCIIAIVEEWKTNLMSLVILFQLLCAQHVSDKTPDTQVLYTYQLQQGDKTHHTKHITPNTPLHTVKVHQLLKHPSLQNKTTDVVIHQQSRRLLKMDILMTETCWAHNKWNKIISDIKLVFHSSTIAMMHGPINIR